MLRPLISHPADADEVRSYLDQLSREFEDERRRCDEAGDRHGQRVNLVRVNLLRELRERLIGK